MSLTDRIIDIVCRAKGGVSTAEIIYSLETYEDFDASDISIAVTIHSLMKRGLIITHGRERCDHCATVRKRYYPTVEGRVRHANG